MKDKILEALGKLDVNNDNHWTADGLPSINAVKFLGGQSLSALKRESITEIASTFVRSNPVFENESSEDGDLNDGNESESSETESQNEEPQKDTNVVTDPSEELQETEKLGRLSIDPSFFTPENIVSIPLSDLTTINDALKLDLEDANAEVNKATERLNALHKCETLVVSQMDKINNPADKIKSALQGYFKTQSEIQSERAKKHAELEESGVKLPSKSQIDIAMGHRRGFGRTRPSVPFKNPR